MPRSLPSQDYLRTILHYDVSSGRLFWKERPGKSRFNTRFAGKPAFESPSRYGYLTGRLLGKAVFCHRVVYKLVFGEDPEDVDHINGIRTDNRIENLRSVTRSVNLRNRIIGCHNTSGVIGVSQTPSGKWRAYILRDVVGLFNSKEEAAAARAIAIKDYAHFTDRHGSKK